MLQFHATSVPQVSDFMTETVIALKPGQTMWRAVKILLDGRISGAPVIDDEYNVMGILSERDCVLFLVNARYYEGATGTVEEHMSKGVISISQDADIFAAADLFRQHNFRRLPVLDGNRLVGILSRRDVMRTGMMMWKPRETDGAPFVPDNLKSRVEVPHIVTRPDFHG